MTVARHCCVPSPTVSPLEPATSATQVKVATTLSAAAQEKGVDCAKVTFTLVGGERVHLDFMPTIGAESYEAADRVRRRPPASHPPHSPFSLPPAAAPHQAPLPPHVGAHPHERAHPPRAHCPLPTAHRPPPTAHCPLLTAHCPLPTHCLQVPRRNQRGTAREDSLRRDLAVSSMLLRVTLPEGQVADSGV